jgi:hypothetical protein
MRITLKTQFDETGHAEKWRNDVAKQLNVLLGRATFFHETSNDESDREAEKATLAIVERVATFEEIQIAREGQED